MRKGRFYKLPKWAQKAVEDRDAIIAQKDREIEMLKRAHGILFDHGDWFVINGPRSEEYSSPDGVYNLFFLSHTGAHPACSLAPGDVLLVGRKKV